MQRTGMSILIGSPLPDEVLDDFRAHFEVAYQPIGPAGSDQLSPLADGHSGLVVSIDTPLRRSALLALPQSIRVIGTYSVGHEHIDLEAARDRGLVVLNTPAALTDSVAELAIFLMLGAARRATESIELIRSGRWTGWTARPLNGMELAGKDLGILGMGRIGRAIAARARAFGMRIHYSNRTRLPPADERHAHYYADPDLMLPCIDILVLAAPSTAGTRGFLNAERVSRLKAGNIVVNVARGDLIDDEALIGGLTSGHIRAAGLDVFNREPHFDPRYASLPNVFLVPHIGSSTIEARRRMAAALIRGLLQWQAGEAPANRIA